MTQTEVGVQPVAVPLWWRAAGRVRGFALPLGLFGLVAGVMCVLLLPEGSVPPAVIVVLGVGGFAALLFGGVVSYLPGGPSLTPRPVASPVAGRWSALNSPASRVPSHGTHGQGQSFAIDLLYEPSGGARPAFGSGAAFRPPEDFPAYGQPVYAPDDGRVVAVRDRARDHRSRSTWPAVAYLMVSGSVRELAGSRHILGNHVVLDLGDGTYATLAHLQRGSVAVRPGQRVRRGEVLGRCGNTGNSSEPHLHFQLADHRWAMIAAGYPFVFAGVRIEGDGRTRQGDTVPRNGEHVVTTDVDTDERGH